MKKTRNETFDSYADNYDVALAQGISVSGENKAYFARRRVEWLRDCLSNSAAEHTQVMDYGCGTGSSAPYLLDVLGAKFIIGTDRSTKSLELAKKMFQSKQVQFSSMDGFQPDGSFDLVFCNGVFHHIPPDGRYGAIDYVFRSLRPGGIFAFWENNPWNPGTRYVMSRITFDRDAVTLSAPEARRLLRTGGFEILSTDFLFIFPKLLRWFRWIETYCSRLPIGAQYQVLCQKPR
jgi:SAM-dependent methyltransferase